MPSSYGYHQRSLIARSWYLLHALLALSLVYQLLQNDTSYITTDDTLQESSFGRSSTQTAQQVHTSPMITSQTQFWQIQQVRKFEVTILERKTDQDNSMGSRLWCHSRARKHGNCHTWKRELVSSRENQQYKVHDGTGDCIDDLRLLRVYVGTSAHCLGLWLLD